MSGPKIPARFRPVSMFNPCLWYPIEFDLLDGVALDIAATSTGLEPEVIEDFQSSLMIATIEGAPYGSEGARVSVALRAGADANDGKASPCVEATVTYSVEPVSNLATVWGRALWRTTAFKWVRTAYGHVPQLRLTVVEMLARNGA